MTRRQRMQSFVMFNLAMLVIVTVVKPTAALRVAGPDWANDRQTSAAIPTNTSTVKEDNYNSTQEKTTTVYNATVNEVANTTRAKSTLKDTTTNILPTKEKGSRIESLDDSSRGDNSSSNDHCSQAAFIYIFTCSLAIYNIL